MECGQLDPPGRQRCERCRRVATRTLPGMIDGVAGESVDWTDRMRYVLFDVDGTLIDALNNQRRVWAGWAERYGLDAGEVYEVALRTRPMETFGTMVSIYSWNPCLRPFEASRRACPMKRLGQRRSPRI